MKIFKEISVEDLRRDDRDLERAAIVAYLRERASAPHPTEAGERLLSPVSRGLLRLMADRIERGEHIADEEG
jgi:hypothetical protein